MYVGRNFTIIDVGENEVFSLDFAKDLDEGETISSAVWECSDEAVLDPMGDPVIFQTVVSQRLSALAVGSVTIGCMVTTSSGNERHLYSHATVQQGRS